MTSPILVIGHKNPDNDSICSAIAYAWFKNEVAIRKQKAGQEYFSYLPARLGPLPPESEAMLKKWGIEEPMVINNVFARVSDVMTYNPLTINEHEKLIKAGRILRKHNIQALIVTNDDGTYKGVVSTRMIANRYIASTDLLKEDDTSQMAVASDLIASLDQPVESIMESDVLTLSADDRLDEAANDLMHHPLREAVVLDDNNMPVGIITRSDIAVQPRRRVILVDHNEVSQAAAGIEEAEIVEIIDHHRIADVSTMYPIKFMNMPVGCTATIVTLECQRLEITPPPHIAALLLSAIMTDTVVLKSPTVTDTDRRVVDYLCSLLDVDPVEFGMEVFSYREGDDDMPIEKLVCADSKEFSIGEGTILIAQHETTNLDAVLSREEEIREHMNLLIENNNYVFVLLMVTDIIAEGSQLICEGKRRIVNNAFGITCTGKGGTWMPGVLSRKKQVAARILEA